MLCGLIGLKGDWKMWKNRIIAILFFALAVQAYGMKIEYEHNGEVFLLIGDRNRDGYNDLLDIGPLTSAWLDENCDPFNPCNGADVFPGSGDGNVNFGDFAAIAAVFGECIDPKNPDCTHLPLTLYEPPSETMGKAKGIFNKLRSKVRPFSGEYTESVTDLVIPGLGVNFEWVRTYRSRTGSNTAMGNNWNFPYNIYLEPYRGALLLHDGTGRSDTYNLQRNGKWIAEGFFRELRLEEDNSFTLVFPDSSTWQFLPLDDPNAPGKISAITDRNDNSLKFEYDEEGRLVVVIDPLNTGSNGRIVNIGYDSNDLITDITDWAGRQVKYEYYEDGDANGSAGDLKSVTTPAVVDNNAFEIPAGHEYPDGKTAKYTYTKGFEDEELNHNLLTITDPNGQIYLQNFYGIDPNEHSFDRVTRQIMGEPDDIIDFTYLPHTPDANNNYAVTRVTINDRMGNVSDYFYDNLNRLVIELDYTGRADSNIPTTGKPDIGNPDLGNPDWSEPFISNKPVNPLRADDPFFFGAKYEYNDDSLLTRVIWPNLNEELFNYDQFNPSRLSQGNLLQSTSLPSVLGGDQSSIVELFEYDPNVNHGTNMVTRYVDPRGNETSFEYDAQGNLTRRIDTILGPEPDIVENFQYNGFGQVTEHILPDNNSSSRRKDGFIYYSNPNEPHYGYLKDIIIDGNNFALAINYEYDSIGNITRIVDPNGQDTQFVIDQLNQVIRTVSREVTDGSGIRYKREVFYDKNNNVVRIEVQDINDGGILQSNPNLTTTYEYDILDRLIRTTAEVNSVHSIVTEYEHDDNGNRTLTRSGEATNGNQPNNIVRTLFDERNLVYRIIRGAGDPNQSTTQHDYDNNGNLKRLRRGLEDVPRVTEYQYDGYNRRIRTIDPMGNKTEFHYDPSGNVTSARKDGELIDIEGDVNNVRLFETTYEYDSLDRHIRTVVLFFDPNTQVPLSDGNSITDYLYNDVSQLTKVTDDNGNQTRFEYDTANRLNSVIDPRGNTSIYTYDRKSNIIEVNEIDISDLGGPNITFTTAYAYDNLDRLIRVVDNAGNSTSYAYDSRDNLRQATDSLDRQSRYEYDGINRLIRIIYDMDGDGADASDSNDIMTIKVYDDNSRLIEQIDDNGNPTTYEYDSLGRITRRTYADGTSESGTYDVHDDLIGQLDAAGSSSVNTYDKLHRLKRGRFTTGPGVSNDTTFENYAYDGLSRLVFAEDDDSVVTRTYDSLSNIVEEVQNGKVVISTHDGLGNQLSCTYPGGRIVTNTYDALNRLSTNPAGSYSYVGERVRRVAFGSGIQKDNSYDDLGRITSTIHSSSVGTIDWRSYTWDKVSNKTSREDVRIGGPQLSHSYTYDALDRLISTTVTNPRPVRDTVYTLDGVGNRTNVAGSPNPGPYTMSTFWPIPADFWMNQYTTTSFDSREYDDNGNLTRIDNSLPTQENITYDYLDQMVEHTDLSTGITTTYAYDAMQRRIRKTVASPVGPSSTTNYFYDGPRVVEEQDVAGATLATYVYGNYVDEVLSMHRGGIDHFYHSDDMYNIMAVTNSTGNVVERYEYGDYGEPEIIDTFGATLPASAIGNPYLFNGRRYDDETGLYYYRTRYMDPAAGRFTSRDTLGIWGDESNLGNGNTYAGNNPWSNLDPFGLKTFVLPHRLENSGSGGKKSREIVVVGSKVKEVVRSAMKIRPLHDRVLVSPSSSSSSGSSLTVPVLILKKKVHFPLYDSVTIKRALGGGKCEAVDWRSTSGGCARASVKGLKEKIHFPFHPETSTATGERVNSPAFGAGLRRIPKHNPIWTNPQVAGGRGRILVDASSSSTSDDNGQFWFMDLEPGIHTAAIAIPNLLDARKGANESSAAGGYHWQARNINAAFGDPGGTLAVARVLSSDEDTGGITFGDGIHGRAACCGSISLFRPMRITPIPFISGPQTAVFVGGSGEEIWPDKFGRIKIGSSWYGKASKDMILKGKKILQN